MTSSPEMARQITCTFAAAAVLLLLLVVPSCVCAGGEIKEYCSWEALEASCPGRDQVIVMDYGRYGRMRDGKCVTADLGHMGCFLDVTAYMDSHCSGKRQCKMPVTNFIADNIRPCIQDVTSYMEADYHCQTVEHVPRNQQCHEGHVIKLSSESGFISSLSPSSSASTSSSPSTHQSSGAACTWSLTAAQPGQTLNFTLWDFGVMEKERQQNPEAFCHRYAIVKDGALASGGQREVTICAEHERHQHVYTSKSHAVQIQVFRSEDTASRFMLQYEVIGCPDLDVAAGLQVARDSQKATVTCPGSGRSWTLRCQDTKWVGAYGNCTPEIKSAAEESGIWQALFGDGWSSPKGLAVVVALGVLLGIIIGALLLCVMIFLLKKRHRLPQQRDKNFATINHQRTPQADNESRDLEQDYYREKLLHVDHCDPDLVTTGGKCLCPDETTVMTMNTTSSGGYPDQQSLGSTTSPCMAQQQQQPQHQHQITGSGTMRSVYVYPHGPTHLYEKPGYNDIVSS